MPVKMNGKLPPIPNLERMFVETRREVAEAIRSRRTELDVTQFNFAIDQSTLSDLECRKSNPTLRTMVKALGALGLRIRVEEIPR